MRKTALLSTDNKLIDYLANLLKVYPVLDYNYDYPVERNFRMLKKNVVELLTSDHRNSTKAIVKVVNTWEQDDPKEFNVDLSYTTNSKKRKNICIQLLPDYLCEDLFKIDGPNYWEHLKVKLYTDSEVLKKKYVIGEKSRWSYDGEGQIRRAMDDTQDNLGDYLPKWLLGTPYMYWRFWGDLSSRFDTNDYGYNEHVVSWYRNWEKKNLR